MITRVLLADPDEALLETYQAFLKRQGFDVRAVTDGENCLATLHSFAPHVLVLEPELPGDWGLRILTHLSAACRTSTPLVIVLTRHEMDLRRFRFFAHHLKPYSLHDLAAGIREAASALGSIESYGTMNVTHMP